MALCKFKVLNIFFSILLLGLKRDYKTRLQGTHRKLN